MFEVQKLYLSLKDAVMNVEKFVVILIFCTSILKPPNSLFSEKLNHKNTRLAESKNICLPVPGFPTLPSNLMAKTWNSIPGIESLTTLGSAKSLVNKWAKTIPR